MLCFHNSAEHHGLAIGSSLGDEVGADAYVKSVVEPDLAETRRLGLATSRWSSRVFPGAT